MRRTRNVTAQTLRWAACGLALIHASSVRAEYAFPIADPYLATVLGTPPALRAEVPDRIPARVRSLALHEDREIPSIFWHERTFHYSIAAQRERAPLVFVIAGTGARYDSANMVFLQKALYQAGLSVVNVTSPTQVDFITTASNASVPGFMDADVRDLYTAMQRIHEQIEEQVDVSAFYLAGYSLGGTQSAFLGHLDQREGAFGFEKILLINPSVSLYSSVRIFDDMLRRSIPGGVPDLQRLVNDLFRRVAGYFHERGREPIDAELLFHIAEAEDFSRSELEALISVAFRIASARMLFTSDVMSDSGMVVPTGTRLTRGTSLTPYLKVTTRWSFVEYLDEVLLPYWNDRHPDLTRAKLIEAGSLESIRDFLRRSDHIAVMTNADDMILAPGEIEFLERTFGERATIYPLGGHCGNLKYRENVAKMVAFFEGDSGEPK
jgi:hypothetical protein